MIARQRPTDYIDSYYRRTAAEITRHAPLEGRGETEICVIGGGLAGLTTALELARAKRSVTLLEARRLAWGASGRNGGFCSPGYSEGLEAIVAKLGRDHARELYRLSDEAVDYVSDTMDALGVRREARATGHLSAQRHPAMDQLKRQQAFLFETVGASVQVLRREETRALLKSPAYHESLLNPHAFAFHPLNYAQAIGREIARLGGALHEDSPVRGLEKSGPRWRVRTEGGEILADHVVIACGGYTDGLVPRLRRAILPIATYVMLTEPLDARVEEAIATRHAISDGRRAGDYYRVVEEGRILWGGRITARTRAPDDLAQRLKGDMVSVYPQLAEAKIEAAWSGLMGYARHAMPQIGTLGDGRWYCTGFGGHGMNTTAVGGRLIAAAIDRGDDRYRLFAPFGLAWNGGPFGPAAAQLTYWKLQLQDWLAERRAG